MSTRSKIIASAAAATVIIGSAALALTTYHPSPVVEPLRIYRCCSVLGCREVASPAECRPSDDLTTCDCPLTNPDGSVGCGC